MRSLYSLIILFSLLVTQVIAQELAISGKVSDSDGAGIIGASIKVLPGNKAVGLSDANGMFTINVPALTKSLIFTAVGYKANTVIFDANTKSYSVVLLSSDEEIETVTINYVAKKKETLTGSAVVISAKDIKDAPAANFTDLLQGRVPGMNVQLNNGTPGMRGSMSIRGLNSSNVSMSGNGAFLSPTSPLFVIDGVPIEEGSNFEYGFQTQGPGISPISMIPVEEIETIVILKDAQATALYGSRGAYGVILVTTKRGNSNVPIISYQSKYFMSTVPKLRPIIGGMEESRIRVNQILQYDSTYRSGLELINDTPWLADSLNAYYNNSTDWQSHFYGNQFNMQQSLNFSGGNQKFNYKVAPGYFKQNGIIRNTGFTRYSVQTNMQYRPSDAFLISGYLTANMARNSTGSGNAFEQSGVANSVNTSSLLPSPSIFSGSYDALGATSIVNDNKTGNMITQVQLEYEFLKGLRASTTLKYQYDLSNQDRFTPEILNSGESNIYMFESSTKDLYNRNMLQYNTTLFDNEKHVFNAFAFMEATTTSYRAQAMDLNGTGSDQIQVGLGYNTRNTRGGILNNLYDRRTVGYAGQMSYQYDSKYIVDLSYRLDGTSTSGGKSPWSHNPTAGVRWNFSREELLQDQDWLSEGSFRVTWGRNIFPTGSIFDVYGKYTMDDNTYNNEPTVSIDLGQIPNINLTPITTTQWNFAVDLGFFNNMFTMTYEHYYKENTNELADIDLANINAFTKVVANDKAIVNRGHELSLFYRPNAKNEDWRLTFYGNMAYNKDIQSQLPNNVRQILEQHPTMDYVTILQRLGRNTFSNVLYHYRGVFQSNDDVPVNPATGLRYRATNSTGQEYFFRAGDPYFTDLNGDYILDQRDLVVAGNSRPRITGGFGATIQYKAWSIQPNIIFSIKRDIINNAAADMFRGYYYPTKNPDAANPSALVPLDNFDYWTYANADAFYPNPFDFRRAGFINPYRYNSTLFQEDGSYVKLGSTTISYNVDRDYVKKRFGITGLRLYVNANNIYTWSRYSGPDPELVSDLGYDSSAGYPRAREFTFGVDVQF